MKRVLFTSVMERERIVNRLHRDMVLLIMLGQDLMLVWLLIVIIYFIVVIVLRDTMWWVQQFIDVLVMEIKGIVSLWKVVGELLMVDLV